MTTDATKLPEHIVRRYDLRTAEVIAYEIYTPTVTQRIDAKTAADDLRSVANDMDAQAGRTAAPVDDYVPLDPTFDDLDNPQCQPAAPVVTGAVAHAAIVAVMEHAEVEDGIIVACKRQPVIDALTAALDKQPRDATSGEGPT